MVVVCFSANWCRLFIDSLSQNIVGVPRGLCTLFAAAGLLLVDLALRAAYHIRTIKYGGQSRVQRLFWSRHLIASHEQGA